MHIFYSARGPKSYGAGQRRLKSPTRFPVFDKRPRPVFIRCNETKKSNETRSDGKTPRKDGIVMNRLRGWGRRPESCTVFLWPKRTRQYARRVEPNCTSNTPSRAAFEYDQDRIAHKIPHVISTQALLNPITAGAVDWPAGNPGIFPIGRLRGPLYYKKCLKLWICVKYLLSVGPPIFEICIIFCHGCRKRVVVRSCAEF